MEIINDGQWIGGQDSISYTLAQGSYAWGQNIVNRGGILETRQGFAEIAAWPEQDPRGLAQITIGSVTWLIAAIGNYIYKLNLNNPVDGLVRIPGIACPAYTDPPPGTPPPPIPVSKRMVHFELCVQAQKSTKVTDPNGTVSYTVEQLDTPKFVIIIQDGVTPAQFWDPSETQQNRMAGRIDAHPDFIDTVGVNTPTGSFMRWVGDRLWLVQGKKVRASDLLNPFQFTDEVITASGGSFYLPDNGTGMGVTHDYKALLVFTHFTTTAFQVGVELRDQWNQVQDFQRVIFPSIGCASHRSIVNMYGMTWWISHDGLVGLDNAMAAYQTTRLDIKDLNMMRSKQDINWATGGGAAGTFGNFLFFSVPSASKWNQHTWVLDQAPISMLAGSSPPSWAANWTGIRPEQWVTCQVLGKQRCFFISRDLTDQGHQSTIWEALIGQRMDVPEVNGIGKARDIGCAFESRFMGLSPSQYCKLRWIELDIAEIVGDVSLKVYYCGRRTSYKQIVDTHLTATVSATTEEVLNIEDPIPVAVPQYRTVRSVTDVHESSDRDIEVQTPYLRNKDREFSVLVQWNGQMAVSGLRLAVDPEPDYMEGTDYPDEYLYRVVTAEGTGGIGGTLPPPNTPSGQLTSKFMSPTKPRWVEFPSYDSAVPNGVFFVSELEASPPPKDYPSTSFPITANITSETQGTSIYYTVNGPVPHGPPDPVGTLYSSTTRPVLQINQTLRAIGVRSGLSPTILLTGQYTQSKVADVIFNPPPGQFPPDEFKHDPPPYTGPVVAYNFNEGTGTIAADSSPNSVDATAIDTTWNATGKYGKALNFNGSTGRVWIANPSPTVHPELNFNGSMTLSAWINVTSGPPFGGQNVIVGRSDGHQGWSIYTDFFSHACVSVSSGPNAFAVRASAVTIPLNTWTHVAGIYSPPFLHIYVNGVLANGTLTGTVPPMQTLSPSVVQVGAGNSFGYFHGIIDDVRIYDRAIQPGDVMTDMNTAVPDSTAPPVQAGFPVLMTCATAGAAIHYVLDSYPPDPPPVHSVTTSDPLYDPAAPPHPYAFDTLRAKAFKTAFIDSDQTNGLYAPLPRCGTPTFTPDGGAYENGDYPKSIVVASIPPGSQLRVSINDTDVQHSAIRTNPYTASVSVGDTIRAIAQKEGLSDSLVGQATYTVRPDSIATPVLQPATKVLHNNHHDQYVTITCDTPNVSVRWRVSTHDDLTPPIVGQPGTNVIASIPEDGAVIHLGPAQPGHIGHKTLRVIAYRMDMTDSVMVNGVYDYGD